MRTKSALGALLFTLVFAGARLSSAQSGPLDPYYLTDLVNNVTVIVQGTTATMYNQAVGGEGPIAIYGDVRTAGSGYSALSQEGAKYNLALVDSGVRYSNFPLNEINLFFDGTTDGTFNYVADNQVTDEVYRTGRDWSNLTPLFFDPGTSGRLLGLTYDPNNQSLWVSDVGSDVLYDCDMAGNVLSSFHTGVGTVAGLGFDPGDGTLWFDDTSSGKFYQFSTSGTQKQVLTYANLSGLSLYGGEFNLAPAPEPASLVGLGLGIVTLARRLCRRLD